MELMQQEPSRLESSSPGGATQPPGGSAAPPKSSQPAPPLTPDMKRLERIRRKKRARRIRTSVVCVVLLAGVLAYFGGVYGASLALLGDVFDSISIALTPGQSYPASFSVPGFIEAQPLAGGFVALGKKDLLIQSANGAEVRRIQHGYARPCITVGNNRVCVYNRGGTSLRVESRSRTLFENEFDSPILLCAMSPNGTLAVFTKSQMTVYDSMFVNVFDFYTGELPTALAFCSDNKQLAVGSPTAQDGALGGTVYLLSTASDQPRAVIRNTEGVPLQIQYLSRQQVLVVYTTFAAVYATDTGEELYRYSFGEQTLQSAAFSAGKYAALLFGDGTHGSLTQLVVLDTTLTPIGQADVGVAANSVAADRTGAYVLASDAVLAYKLDGTLLGQIVSDAAPLAVVDARQTLLLTENTVYALDSALADAQKAEE